MLVASGVNVALLLFVHRLFLVDISFEQSHEQDQLVVFFSELLMLI